MNVLRTGLLLAAIGALAVSIGAYFFGLNGAIIGLGLALAFQAYAYFNGHKMALRYAHAQPLPPNAIPWLTAANAQLSQRAGITPPTLYLSPDPQPNAFAAGRNPEVAVVCFNQGLLNAMSEREVIAVLAHEIAHIKNRDSLTMTITAAMASFITMLAQLAYFLPLGGDNERNPLVDLLVFLVAPIAALMLQMGVSRTREYAADRTAAELMGDARPMQDALVRLEAAVKRVPSPTAQPAMEPMYIASPFTKGGLAALFSTHPSIESRVRALEGFRA
ncbi:MAG: M48 family metalloprotease [Fimbriimonadaceae bacterium]